jgi:glycosyltransferase involved in cell wall biosynthesis
MKIHYLYNEKLPKRTAHDAYVWRNCYFLSQLDQEVSLITGSNQSTFAAMQKHYLPHDNLQAQERIPFNFFQRLLGLKGEFSFRKIEKHFSCFFYWIKFPLIRKSFFKISWNYPFFWLCQQWLKITQPDWAIFSVYKQASYHFKRPISQVLYCFEVHDLAWYPLHINDTFSWRHLDQQNHQRLLLQKRTLERANCVTVTTNFLKKILCNSPFNLTCPIHVIPLASEVMRLKRPILGDHIQLTYVGQLYPDQGVDRLIEALAHVPGIHLKIIGGQTSDINRLQSLISQLALTNRIYLHGFVSPSLIPSLLHSTHALAAPFYPTPHMRCVAHTKLADYGKWALPVIAPRLENVLEEVWIDDYLFDASDYPNSIRSLVAALHQLLNKEALLKSYDVIDQKMDQAPNRFSWHQRSIDLSQILKDLRYRNDSHQ